MHKYNKEVLRLKPERSAIELECSLSNRKNGYRIVTKMLFFKKWFKNSFLSHIKQAVPITLSQKCIIMTEGLQMNLICLNNSGNLIESCALYMRQLGNTEDRIALGVST